jgi:hypothetical protein
MRRFRRAVPLILIASLVVGLIGWLALSTITGPRAVYFPESGHAVREPFLSYFSENGGVETFGYPLTNAYRTQDDTLVQTFQHAQMQLTVRGVGLAPIGLALHLGEGALAGEVDPAFAKYYQSLGGADFFGEPLGAASEENGMLLQDFENVRMMHDQAGGVHLASLGSAYLTVFPPPAEDNLAQFDPRMVPTPGYQIRASVSVEHPTVGQNGEQTLYLYVEDGAGGPVSNAQALAVLYYDDATAEIELAPTDQNGLSSASFVVPPAIPGGQVLVRVHVLVGEHLLTVETTYFQWW